MLMPVNFTFLVEQDIRKGVTKLGRWERSTVVNLGPDGQERWEGTSCYLRFRS
jgi:hypothetical protein